MQPAKTRSVLVTNVSHYAGTGAVLALLGAGSRVVCHDPAFASRVVRTHFQEANPGTVCLAASDPAAILAEVDALGIELHAIVSNDVHAIAPRVIGEIELDEFRRTFESVFMFPVHLAQVLLPAMKLRGSGSFVFVTSARSLRPERGYAVPTAIRAATTAFALAMAKEVASSGIQVNVVAPNYLHSELYYPRERFLDDPDGRALIASLVPMGRLGTQAEVGELIAFLASGRSNFVTGQVIHFTGGWP